MTQTALVFFETKEKYVCLTATRLLRKKKPILCEVKPRAQKAKPPRGVHCKTTKGHGHNHIGFFEKTMIGQRDHEGSRMTTRGHASRPRGVFPHHKGSEHKGDP